MKLYLIIAVLCAGTNHFSHATQVSVQHEKKVCEQKPIDHALDKYLLKAAKKGDLKKIQKLLAGHTIPDVNAKDNYIGNAALIFAAHHGFTAIVQELIAAGADVNIENKLGNTSLVEAAREGHTAIVQALIVAGAHINANNNGNTALMRAAYKGHTATTQALVAAGAHIEAKDNFLGNTALILATAYGYTATVQVLIAAGAELNAKNNYGNTALMLAARYGFTAIVQALIAAGADYTEDGNKTARDYAKDKNAYDKAIAAGLAERKRYLAQQVQAKKIVEEEKQLAPCISKIIAEYAYGPNSPIDLPKRAADSCCVIQ